jgi:hypothetical protein
MAGITQRGAPRTERNRYGSAMDERRPLHQTVACQFPLYPLATEVVRRCNLSRRVISAVLAINRVLPLFPEQATFSWVIGISQRAQNRPPKSSALESKGDGVDQRTVGYFLREWSSEINGLIAATRTFAGASSGSTVGGNGVTTEISDQPPAQPPNCASWCDRAVLARQRALTAVSTLYAIGHLL